VRLRLGPHRRKVEKKGGGIEDLDVGPRKVLGGRWGGSSERGTR